MWYVWTAVLCFQLAVCQACAPGATVTPEPTTPETVSSQTPPPSSPAPKTDQKTELADTPAAPPPPKEKEPEITLPTGPMRVEPWALSESRNRYDSDVPPNVSEPTLALRAKLTGERLVHMVGRGELIIEEMVDDTGAILKSLADYKTRELTKTYSIRAGKRMMMTGFASLTVNAKATSRQARKLTKVKGYVNVVYATETEEIMIDNPLQYLGSYIEHPRLKEVGLKIKVISPGKETKDRRDTSGMALEYEDGARKHIRKLEFFDAWLKPLYARERPAEKPDGSEYVLYNIVAGQMNADTQMLLKFYPEIEEEKVEFTFEDLELP